MISELRNILSLPSGNNPSPVIEGAIIGMLLLDEHFDHTATDFVDDIRTAWLEFLKIFKDNSGTNIYTRDVYEAIFGLIDDLRPGVDPIDIFYQEFATVGRYVLQSVDEIPPSHPSFITQVRLGFDRYVSGKPTLESLELPPLTGEDQSDVEVEPENLRVAAILFAAKCVEDMYLFRVVDRVTEIWLNGALAVGADSGGRALDQYYWDREDRLAEVERRSLYSRVLGAPGGDVSKEIQPNTQFESLWMRFLSSLAEFDRQQRVDDILDNGNGGRPRPVNLTGEYVRKAGRDLAANLSLYCWGGTQFAARRLNAHIATALNILKQPSIQKSYGVTNPYQVIERVASNEFGTTPNIVRFRTMADAGNKIINIVARYHRVWTGSSGQPLFEERGTPQGNVISGDIALADREELMRQTQFYLAVNGVKDDQVYKNSMPELSAYSPSLPAFGAMQPTAASNNGHAGTDGALDAIKQMVAQGQVPTMDQLQKMLSGMKAGA